MAINISGLRSVAGFKGASLVDSSTGNVLAAFGGSAEFDPETEAEAHARAFSEQAHRMKALGLDESVEDIVMTFDGEHHILRPLGARPDVLIYLAVDAAEANLANARVRLKTVEAALVL